MGFISSMTVYGRRRWEVSVMRSIGCEHELVLIFDMEVPGIKRPNMEACIAVIWLNKSMQKQRRRKSWRNEYSLRGPPDFNNTHSPRIPMKWNLFHEERSMFLKYLNIFVDCDWGLTVIHFPIETLSWSRPFVFVLTCHLMMTSRVITGTSPAL